MQMGSEHPVRRLAREQGRRLSWVAAQLGISYSYLHQILSDPTTRAHRPSPGWFYPSVARVLGVSLDEVVPSWEVAAAA
jgi:hypothetical protein